MTTPTRAVFAHLLQKAVTDPGTISQAYRQFHAYSLGNQLLALGQCLDRGIDPGPMATYPRWKQSQPQPRRSAFSKRLTVTSSFAMIRPLLLIMSLRVAMRW